MTGQTHIGGLHGSHRIEVIGPLLPLGFGEIRLTLFLLVHTLSAVRHPVDLFLLCLALSSQVSSIFKIFSKGIFYDINIV